MDAWGRDEEDEQRPDRGGRPDVGPGRPRAPDLGAAVEEQVATPPWARDELAITAGGPRRPGAVLLALAVLPWLLVGAVVLRGPGTAGSGPATGADTTALATPTEGPAPLPADPAIGAVAATPDDRSDPSGDETAPPSPGTAGPMADVGAAPRRGTEVLAAPVGGDLLVAAAALGEVVVRARLTTGGPPVDGWAAATGASPDPADVRHVDHVATESVHVPAAGRIVVVVLAVVLRSDDGSAWSDARLERHGVALELDAGNGLRIAGPVWPLPPPTPPATAVPGGATAAPEVDDPDLRLAAVAGLEAGGWTVDDLTLTQPAPDLLVAAVRGTGPDGRQHPGLTVWLLPTATGFEPAGTPPGSTQPPSEESAP